MRRLALGDPEAVPAGIYARRWLEGRGLWERLRGRVVPTLDVRAALAAVESGAAEAGIVYRTDARDLAARARGLRGPGRRGARTSSTRRRCSPPRRSPARAPFLEHLRSPEARAVFARLGFEPLEGR